MLRRRFSFVSVTAMIGATVFAVLEVLRARGMVGFTAQQGFPFRWYWYTDISTQYDPGYGYNWGALVADIGVWFTAILVLGLFIEFIVQRFSKKHESEKAT